jgi:hypothetical protein
MIALVTSSLIVLHAVDGRPVTINPSHVTSLQQAKPGEANRSFVEGVHCMVNLTDGKFISTRETCETIRRLMDDAK